MPHDMPELGEPKASLTPKRGKQIEGIVQVALVFAALVAGVAGNALLSRSATPPEIRTSSTSAIAVEVVRPQILDMPLRIETSGTIQTRNVIDLGPQVGGRVVAVSPNLAKGGAFRAGEVLFRLDDQDHLAALERARADLASAQADLELELAEAELARREWFQVNPDEPIPALVSRQPQINRAEAKVLSAEAALNDAKLTLSRVSFTLPFNGRVLSSTIEVGQNLNVGQSYGRVYKADEIEISVPIEVSALKALAPAVGREARVYVTQDQDEARHSIEARVARSTAELDPVTRLAELTLVFTSTQDVLPGEFVDIEITGPDILDAHLIPERALTDDKTFWIAKDGKLASRQADILFSENGHLVTRAFDTGDGVVLTRIRGGFEGAEIDVEFSPQLSGAMP